MCTLYRLTSRQHFFFARYQGRIPQTYANETSLVSYCNKPKQLQYFNFSHVTRDDLSNERGIK